MLRNSTIFRIRKDENLTDYQTPLTKMVECDNCKKVCEFSKKCPQCKSLLPDLLDTWECIYYRCPIYIDAREWKKSCSKHSCTLSQCDEGRIENHKFCWFHKCKFDGCNIPCTDLGNVCQQHKTQPKSQNISKKISLVPVKRKSATTNTTNSGVIEKGKEEKSEVVPINNELLKEIKTKFNHNDEDIVEVTAEIGEEATHNDKADDLPVIPPKPQNLGRSSGNLRRTRKKRIKIKRNTNN